MKQPGLRCFICLDKSLCCVALKENTLNFRHASEAEADILGHSFACLFRKATKNVPRHL